LSSGEAPAKKQIAIGWIPLTRGNRTEEAFPESPEIDCDENNFQAVTGLESLGVCPVANREFFCFHQPRLNATGSFLTPC
jgi:hypothetical protein